jgi:HAD superfamily hydrolase (TIGR01484 family)
MNYRKRTRDGLPFRLAGIDIDGTLKGGETISKPNIAAVKDLKKASLIVSPFTGRNMQLTVHWYKLAKLNGPLVTSDGALVRTLGGKLIAKAPIRHDMVEVVRKLGEEYNVTTLLHVNAGACVTTDNFWPEGIARHRNEIGPELSLKDPSWLRRRDVFFMLQAAPKAILDEIEASLERLCPDTDLLVTRYNDEEILYKAPGVHKARTLLALAERLGLTMGQTAFFGDARNDVEALKAAGVGVGMYHGSALAKASADIVAYSPSPEVDFACGVDLFLSTYY